MRKANIQNKKSTLICPKCGSIDVRVDFSNPVVWAYGTNVKYICNSCNHIAPIFPELALNRISSFRKNLKGKTKASRENLVDASTGFNVGIYELALIGMVVLILIPVLLKITNIVVALIIWILLLIFLFYKIIRSRRYKN